MKNKILTITAALFLINLGLNAQCINGVNTNPPFASNNYLPLDAFGEPDSLYLNGLSWWMPQQYGLTNMGFNSNNTYPDSMAWIQTVSQSSYYNYLKFDMIQKMLSPKNGWELLHINLGRYPDNETTMFGNAPFMSIPYIIIYNRYTGVARIFVRYGNQDVIQNLVSGVRIDLFYEPQELTSPNNISGVLRLGEGLDRSLDRQTKVIKLTSVARHNAQVAFWMSADFQLTYDPCVCFYPGYIDAKFSFFKNTNITLHGRSITTDDNLVQGSNILNNDFLGSFDATTGVNDGFIIYKQMEAMIDDYLERLDKYQASLNSVQKHNEKVKNNQLVLKVAKGLIQVGATFFTGSPEALTLVTTILPSAKAWQEGSSDSIAVNKGKKDFTKALDKALWEIGELLFKEQLTLKPEPDKPSMPIASFSEMYFQGTLTDSADVKAPSFRTPGSLNSIMLLDSGTLRQSYPVYNEALGVFALLNSPKFNVRRSIEEEESQFDVVGQQSNGTYLCNHRITYTERYQFKLDNVLNYFINPVLDVESYEIKAALNVIVNRQNPVAPPASAAVSAFINPNYTNNLGSFNLVDHEFYPLYNIQDSSALHGNSVHYALNSGYPPSNTPQNINITKAEFISPFIPFDAFLPVRFEFGIKNQIFSTYSRPDDDLDPLSLPKSIYGHRIEFDLYLKIAVKIKYNSVNDDNDQNVFDYLFTYKVQDNDLILVGFAPIDIAGTNNNILFEDNLIFSQTYFNGTHIPGCQLHDSVYTCGAFNDIEINGDISVGNGYSVVFKAGNNINVSPNAEITPEVVLLVDPIFNYSNPMPMSDALSVEAFCKDTAQYNGNTLQRSVIAYYDSLAQANPAPELLPDPIEFIIFPNPTTGASQAGIYLPELATVSITIIDVSGKVVGSPVQNLTLANGRNVQNLETESLQPGVYLVHLVVNGEKFVQRLVKQ